MALFQKTVEQKYLKQFNPEFISAKYLEFKDYFWNPDIQDNIRNSKEEQFQEGFLRELFVKILGYTLNPTPNFNLTTEYKNIKDSKKADGAIIFNDSVKAVIELKGTNTTDLSKIEAQAFGYKNNQPDCVYVVTSNFEKLRFYIDNAIENIEFNLFNLTKADFEILYLCLSSESIKNGIPKKVKEESLSQEDIITKKLYQDYSLFKRELHQNLVLLNPQYDSLTLFKKSQKLLDRFLFVFFAEDRHLLPPNFTRIIIRQWQQLRDLDEYIPLYERFKKNFRYLNDGFKGKDFEVYAYNGGLFKPDDILDSLTIDDDLLHKHTVKLSERDFASEVDVNILGHIFENSLNDLDEINAQLAGETIDKTKTKRKKDGVFYTPKYITKYIVENTVGKLCTEKKDELQLIEEEYTTDKKRQLKTKQALLEKLKTYQSWLLQLTICDPACGSGAFLNQALDFLMKEHSYIDELQAKLLGVPMILSDYEKSILENNLFGVDLNEESVEIAKLSLWLRTAQPNRKLNDLNNNIKCGNSLIDDPAVAGDKAFNWHEAFPQVFEKGGFDVVIGNPPYVRAELLGYCRDYLSQTYSVFNPSGDLFSYFYEKSFRLLKPKTGIFGFISNTFDKTTAGVTLRRYLQNNVQFVKFIDFTEVQIFEGATTYPVILIAQNNFVSSNSFSYIKIPQKSQNIVIDIDIHSIVGVTQNLLNEVNWNFKSDVSVALIDRLLKNKTIREIYGKCYRGILTGLNEAFIIPKKYQVGEHVKPIYEGKEIEKWTIKESVQQLILFQSKWTKTIYGDGLTEEQAKAFVINNFPNLMSHILPLEENAKKRFDKGDYYWELRNCAYYPLFEKPKIVFPNLQNKNKFAFDETGAYINAPAVILPTTDKFLTAILNSKLVWYFLTSICVVRNGGYIEVKPQYFELIPLPQLSTEEKEGLNELAERNISNTKQLQETAQKFQRTIQRKFNLEELPGKLQDWYLLTYSEFIKELGKKKVKLSLSDEAEWEDYFLQEQKKALDIKHQIDTTDKEIDLMVYALYGLTEDEIAIVENSNQ